MAHVEDRWYKTVRRPDGRSERIKTKLYGTGHRYRVRYIGPDGKEHSQSYPDRAKREAEAFLVSVESDKLRGAYVDPAAGRMTLAEYATSWVATRSFDESTRESTEQRINAHVLPYLGGRALNSIKPSDIREWDRRLSEKLSVGTRSVTFAHLRSVLSAAVDDGRIARNPCSVGSVKQPRPPVRRVEPWPLATVLAIRSGLLPRYRAMVDVAAGCGLRQGEVFGLGVDDIDLDGGWLHVRRQVKRVRNRLVFGLPKSDRARRIPLPLAVGRQLVEHLAQWKPVDFTLPWESPVGELVSVSLVFTTGRGGVLNRSTFNTKAWKPALSGAGIEPTRETGMHALRHLYASALLDAGESIKALAEYLGHVDPGFTLRTYTHLMPASEDRTRRAIDELFG